MLSSAAQPARHQIALSPLWPHLKCFAFIRLRKLKDPEEMPLIMG
jgi:hypothetical protein